MLVIYGATSAQHVLGGDSGEFATLAATGGVGHPPGYPLYVLLLRALRWIPAAEPAHRASLITALIGAANAALFFVAARAWGASRIASVAAMVTFVFAPLTWQLSTCPEVFALNVSFALSLIALAATTPEDPRVAFRRAGLLALLAGLALSNHHSIVLLAPIGLFAWVSCARGSKRPLAALAASIVGLTVGLLPYAYLLYAARHFDPATTLLWGDTKTLSGVLDHFLRRQYGTLDLGASLEKPDVRAHLVTFLRATVRDLRGVPVLALVGVMVGVWRSKRNSIPFAPASVRFRWFMLLTSLFACGPLFLMRFNIKPGGWPQLIVERFYLLPWAVLLVVCAPALDALAVRALGRIKWLALAPVAAAMALLSFDAVREAHRPTIAHYVHNTLSLVEPNAIIFGEGDHRFGGFLYARLGLHERPDVVFVSAELMLGTWYPAQVEKLVGSPLPRVDSQPYNPRRLFTKLLAAHRPTYFTDFVFEKYRKTVRTYPIGPVMRAVETSGSVPAPTELLMMNDEAFAKFALEGTPPRNMASWHGDLFSSYARPWNSLADAFREQDPERAQACRLRARDFKP
jgi:hypothetical protein